MHPERHEAPFVYHTTSHRTTTADAGSLAFRLAVMYMYSSTAYYIIYSYMVGDTDSNSRRAVSRPLRQSQLSNKL